VKPLAAGGTSTMKNGETVIARIATNSQLGFDCPECGSVLALHQPDETLAHRLLGTCPECKTWFVTDSAKRSWVRLLKIGDFDDKGG
jgi:hypothetical protein